MIFAIELTKKAEKQFAKINKSAPQYANKISILLDLMAKTDNPHLAFGCKKLQNYDPKDCYRWRVNDYRIIGEVQQERILIKIVSIQTRQGAYKD